MELKITDPGTLLVTGGDDAVELSTAEAVDLLGRLTGLLPQMSALALILGYGDPNDEPDSYLCPHCARVHRFDQRDASLVEVDADVRHNDAYVGERGVVHVDQDDQEYATMVFLCGYCGKPVSLPENTAVTYD